MYLRSYIISMYLDIILYYFIRHFSSYYFLYLKFIILNKYIKNKPCVYYNSMFN